MFEKVITVQSAEQLTASNGKPYLKVTNTEGKSVSIFDIGLWNLFEEGASVKLSMEKEGKYWNVKGAELADKPVAKPPPQEPRPAPQPQTKTVEGKNRSFALAYAKDIAVAEIQTGGKWRGLYEAVLIRAEIMNQWLDGTLTIPEDVINKEIVRLVSPPTVPKGGEETKTK